MFLNRIKLFPQLLDYLNAKSLLKKELLINNKRVNKPSFQFSLWNDVAKLLNFTIIELMFGVHYLMKNTIIVLFVFIYFGSLIFANTLAEKIRVQK
jgi:hypothetical protein